MADFSISINGNTRIAQKLEGVEKLLANPRAALEEIGDLVLEEKEQQFDTQGSRFGSKWKALDRRTQIQKARLGYGSKPILERTGRLRAGFKKEVQTYKVTVSNPVTYYPYHQLGMGYNPKRTMLYPTETMKGNIIEVLNKAIRALL